MDLIPLNETHFKSLFEFEILNRDWFEKWVPPRPTDFYIYERFVDYCASLVKEMASGDGLYFVGCVDGVIIGRFNMTFLTKDSIDIGYRVGLKHIGCGYASHFTELLIEEAKKAHVREVYADALVENTASTKVLLKLGFKPVPNQTKDVKFGANTMTLASYHLQTNK